MMTKTPWKKYVWLAPVLVALPYLWNLLVTVTRRLPYPYDLEWMEGGVLAHAWRLQQGEPIYTVPTGEWMPMIYPPGYHSVVATLGSVFGISAPLGRSVSVAATLAALAALLYISRRHFGTLIPGVVGGMLYLASYPNTGAFMDLVRADSLFVGLTAWSLALALEDRKWVWRTSALLLFLAFTVKQNAALMGVPIAFGLWAMKDFKRALHWGLWAAVPALLWVGWMQWSSDGQFLVYLLEVPGAHPMVTGRAFPGTPREISAHLPWLMPTLATGVVAFGAREEDGAWSRPGLAITGAFALLFTVVLASMGQVRGITQPGTWEALFTYPSLGAMAGVGVFQAIRMVRGEGRPGWILGGLVMLTALIMTGLMRAHHGGFINVFMLLYWCTGLALVPVVAWSMRTRAPAVVPVVMALMLGAQMWDRSSEFDGQRLQPTPADYEAGEELVAQLSALEGEVLSPYAAWLPALAGKTPSFHLISLWDVNHRDGPYRKAVGQVTADIRSGRLYEWVLTSEKPMQYGISEGYHMDSRLAIPRGALMPKSGWRARPTQLWQRGPGKGTQAPSESSQTRRKTPARRKPGKRIQPIEKEQTP